MQVARIKKQGGVGLLGDHIMMPFMAIIQGTLTESLQRTHFWNNKKLSRKESSRLNFRQSVYHVGDLAAENRWLLKVIPIFHMSILGGWRRYIVIEPSFEEMPWFPGWETLDYAGVSTVPVWGPVKLLLGPEPVQFFGLDENGHQITVRQIGEGLLGQGGPHRRVPLR